jgi:hypothetical protein
MTIPKIYQLDLPTPNQQLLELVNKFVSTVELDSSSKEWLDQFHHNKINSALHRFATDQEITDSIKDQYSKFFPDFEFRSIIGIMKSANGSPACQPPHIDRRRALAINYYIDLGGDQVTTSFYDFNDEVHPDASSNFQYTDFKKLGHCVFEKNQWYAYNVSQCHSVENITGTRYFLSICPMNASNYKIDNLMDTGTTVGNLVSLC